jgi:competence protein ComEA
MNTWLERNRTVILIAVGVLVAGAAVFFVIRWQPAPSIQIEPPAPTSTPGPTPTPAPIQVYVSGAVVNPDVYTLAPGAIVRDALTAAGGATADADLDRVNLAQLLVAGQQVHIPRVGEAPTPAPGTGGTSAPALTGPLNINTAAAGELELLPGIGPALAQRIVEYRDAHGPFNTIEELQNVSGIGPATLDELRSLITVGD